MTAGESAPSARCAPPSGECCDDALILLTVAGRIWTAHGPPGTEARFSPSQVPANHTVSTREKEFTMTYERPTLAKAGSFRKVTGIKNTGPKDVLGGKQLL
ncbi:hypothetical protein GCM10010245_66910 [Streptomyces spectabilis]|nr:hypothetical protein GCM10010245_66910 [Streptomyces spectabilis]